MMWKNLNKADRTLLGAAVIFLFALCLSVEYKDNVFADGFLFCAEAALVGGIADWFAVTALFEKPLGFPWHTAILPRRRQSFIKATGKMMQKEFFGKKALVSKVKGIDFAQKLSGWLEEDTNQALIVKFLHARLMAWLNEHGQEIAARLKGNFKNVPELKISPVMRKQLLMYAAEEFGDKVRQPEFREKLKSSIDAYAESKMKSPMAMMMAGMAQSMDIINIDEAAELVQKRLALVLDRVLEDDTEENQRLSAVMDKVIDLVEQNLAEGQELHRVLQDSIKDINAGDYLLGADDLQQRTQEMLTYVVHDICKLFANDEVLQREVNSVAYQLMSRGAMQAQGMLGNIVHDVLGTMTDEQINRLVYDKAEPDLLWIRMNGSIVGAIIGLLIFVAMQLAA